MGAAFLRAGLGAALLKAPTSRLFVRGLLDDRVLCGSLDDRVLALHIHFLEPTPDRTHLRRLHAIYLAVVVGPLILDSQR